MNDRPDDRLDEIAAQFRRLPIPDPPDPAPLLGRIAALEAARRPARVAALYPLRSFLMRPVVRYSTAVAALLGLLGWLVLTPGRTVALAEVIQAARRHTVVRYQLREVAAETGRKLPDLRSTVYADLAAPRIRFEHTLKYPSGIFESKSVMVQDGGRDRLMKLVAGNPVVPLDRATPNEKRAIQDLKDAGFEARKAYIYRATQPDGEPFHLDIFLKGQPLLDALRALQAHPETRATEALLDGRKVAQYHLREPSRATTLWVDPQTKLPLRIEADMTRPHPKVAHLRWVYSDFEWDPRSADPAQLFSTIPPSGYRIMEDRTGNQPARTAIVPDKPAGVPAPALDRAPADPASAATRRKLDEAIPMQFPNEIPLVDMLEYVRQSTATDREPGIPFAFDAAGLKRAGQTAQSTVTISTTDEPLRAALDQLLKPLGLTFEVRKGVLTITASAGPAR